MEPIWNRHTSRKPAKNHRKEPKKKEHFFSAYGFTEADITKMAESQQTKEHLLTLLEKGGPERETVWIHELEKCIDDALSCPLRASVIENLARESCCDRHFHG